MNGHTTHRNCAIVRAARSITLGAFLAFSPIVATSCSIPAMNVVEYQKPEKRAAGADALGLLKGRSGWKDALESLRKAGVTNITSARGLDAKDGKVTIDALTGDYMGEVLIFRNAVYSGALRIGADANESTGMYLHIARTEGTNAVIVIGREMSREGYQSVFVLLERSPPKRYFISYGMIPGTETGINDPLMMGDDLGGTGLTFVWRDHRGFPAEHGVILKCDGKELKVTKVGMQKLLGCSCLWDWYNGVHKNNK